MASFNDSSRDAASDPDDSIIGVKGSGFRRNRITSESESDESDVIETSSEAENPPVTPRRPDSSRDPVSDSDDSIIGVKGSGFRSNRITSESESDESDIIENSSEDENPPVTPRRPAIRVQTPFNLVRQTPSNFVSQPPSNFVRQHKPEAVNIEKLNKDLFQVKDRNDGDRIDDHADESNRQHKPHAVNVENRDKVETRNDSTGPILVIGSDNDEAVDEISDKDGACAQETFPEKIMVSAAEYNQQQSKVADIISKINKNETALRTINTENLPDKGANLRKLQENLQIDLLSQQKIFSLMEVKRGTTVNPSATTAHNLNWDKPMVPIYQAGLSDKSHAPLSWDELKKGVANVQPVTFGKKAVATFNAQKAITVDRLHQLHGSLKTCPGETDLAEDPKGLRVELMEHQKRALLWLMWREKQKPSGGILADDMGLGKTLTMISLVMKMKEVKENSEESDGEDEREENARDSKKVKGGTLVVCPASVMEQWAQEIKKKTKRGMLSVEMFHGSRRETSARRLSAYDVVLTTYAIVHVESRKSDSSPLYRVRWTRIILDEAHTIRNHKNPTSDAVFRLPGRSRWSLTGTPVHNREVDLYAQLKFLRCRPFDDFQIWKRWVASEGLKGQSQGGSERLHTVISSLMLRRTKEELLEKTTAGSGMFLELLSKGRKIEVVEVEMKKEEHHIYEKVLILSRTLFAQFLEQRAEKNQDLVGVSGEPNQEYFKMRQMLLKQHRVRDIKQHEILVLILRLRQICCHPSLIKQAFNDDPDFEQDNPNEAIDLLEQLSKMNLNNGPQGEEDSINEEGDTVSVGINKLLSSNHPMFSMETPSSKIIAMLNVLKTQVPEDDKVIIVSQWSGFLKIIGHHLKNEYILFNQLDGSVPVPKRMDLVDRFNDPKSKIKVLLLSLTAGGVGLNLVGGNHLFLLDLHWNPQLEKQAQDRIYRVGQNKSVHIYKFFIVNSIEKRILDLQEKKLSIAESTLTGTKQLSGNKLTLQDLKTLFDM